MTSGPFGERRSGRARRWASAAVALCLLVGGILFYRYYTLFEPMAPERIDRPAPERPDAARPARVVVLISIDGLAPWVLDGTDTPVLDRLAREGVRAESARTVVPPQTLPSHASMLASVAPEVHGLNGNRYEPWRAFEQQTLFTVCAARRLRCGMFAGKRKLVHFAEREPGVERYAFEPRGPAVIDRALAYLGERDADFAMIHLAEVDLSGHSDGWGSEAQRASLRAADRQIGRLLARLPELTDRPIAVLVTSDHGGIGNNHLLDRPENLEIAWIAWGDGVRAGAATGPVSTLDTAPTLLALLGFPAPAGWVGRAQAVRSTARSEP